MRIFICWYRFSMCRFVCYYKPALNEKLTFIRNSIKKAMADMFCTHMTVKTVENLFLASSTLSSKIICFSKILSAFAKKYEYRILWIHNEMCWCMLSFILINNQAYLYTVECFCRMLWRRQFNFFFFPALSFFLFGFTVTFCRKVIH